MSQQKWKQPGEQENTGNNPSRPNNDSNRYEGFEGMNYEQRRQPFKPAGNPNPNSGKPSGKENDNNDTP